VHGEQGRVKQRRRRLRTAQLCARRMALVASVGDFCSMFQTPSPALTIAAAIEEDPGPELVLGRIWAKRETAESPADQ
jgi:hypothetical protein